MPTLTIEDRTSAGRPVGTITLADLPDRITLRELIRLRVRDEVARHNLHPTATFHGLVQPDDSRATADGFRLGSPRRIDWQRQADAAIASFLRNGFFVLVNRRQVVELDEEIVLAGEIDIGFVKLMPLVGG